LYENSSKLDLERDSEERPVKGAKEYNWKKSLRSNITNSKKTIKIQPYSLKETHSLILKQKQAVIDQLKDGKARAVSTTLSEHPDANDYDRQSLKSRQSLLKKINEARF